MENRHQRENLYLFFFLSQGFDGRLSGSPRPPPNSSSGLGSDLKFYTNHHMTKSIH